MSQVKEKGQDKAVARVEWTEPFNSFNSWKGLIY